ncbi:MAG: hypothetical protein JWP58_1077 [Hymenobacter sp.]|nr:hypothetical protein [Hymenobacter sp.]
MSKLRNYTSEVTPAKSQATIEHLLVQAGASTISKFFDDTKRCQGFFFQISVGDVPLTFKLPANADLVYQHFVASTRNLDAKKREQLRAQAERTAWRTLQEWVQIQLDMVAMNQVELLQVLMPYQFDQDKQQTFFQRVMNSDLKLLKP